MEINKMLIKKEFNKKAANEVLAIYWYLILIITAGGIYAMIYIFYSGAYDVRGVEADLLNTKIADCLSYQGQLRESVYSKSFLISNTNFDEKCNLNFNTEDVSDWKIQEQYYTEVNFYEINDTENPVTSAEYGNINWKFYCDIQKNGEYKKLVKCVEKRIYSTTADGNQFLIKILSVVRKTEKNVKQ
jgi:hypothetical protein